MPRSRLSAVERPDPWGAEHYIPERSVSLKLLRSACNGCRGCDLYKHATQAVFGEIADGAGMTTRGTTAAAGVRIMLIGEQPGDQEDVAGRPFVGPAGKLLDRALEEAEIERSSAFVTNAVKHFKWTPAPGRQPVTDGLGPVFNREACFDCHLSQKERDYVFSEARD